jgi:hypothetical protein
VHGIVQLEEMLVVNRTPLYYSREGTRSRAELIPISDTMFALGESTHVEFVRDGNRVTGVRILTPDGQVAVVPRTK